MIYGVWIIHKDGKCLLFREYEGLNINEQLFSGFLVAILAFSKEISNRQLKSINLEDLTLFYKNLEDSKLIFVIAVDSKERESEIREKIDRIEEAFLRKYREILSEWNGEISIFNEFEPELDSLLNTHGIQLPFDLNFLNKTSFDTLIKKFSLIMGKKGKKEIEKGQSEKVIHTFGILENIFSLMDDIPQKFTNAWKRMVRNKHEKKE